MADPLDGVGDTYPMTLIRTLYRGFMFPMLVAAYRGHPLRGLRRYVTVWKQFNEYRRRTAGRESVPLSEISVWLVDDIAPAGKLGEYFYQDTWAFRHVLQTRPRTHVDVASALHSMGFLSQAVPLVYVDIRPI